MCLASMYVSAAYMHTDQKMESDALELSLGTVVNHMGAGIGPWVLCRSSQ